ncbi:O-acetyl-ADP-ribose deacetylase [Corynebacterium mayonis]|uniref:O-acetyl-ADP-ribose deacetylase n=1 Tax=Corynebacterium mayonis TaxID=3062461 RepID=UPI00314041CF
MKCEVVSGDITAQEVDVVVNAANRTLLGGGGVDGAIHRAGGPEIVRECEKVRQSQWPEGLPTGEATATTAGDLAARWVVHTVGPVWSTSRDTSALLESCYIRSLEVADGLGAKTIAFPLVSAGAYGWPIPDAARIAVDAVRAYAKAHPDSAVERVRFVGYSAATYAALTEALVR